MALLSVFINDISDVPQHELIECADPVTWGALQCAEKTGLGFRKIWISWRCNLTARLLLGRCKVLSTGRSKHENKHRMGNDSVALVSPQ